MSQLSIQHHSCPHCGKKDFVKRGHFYKKSTKTYIPRYNCKACNTSFSTRTLSPTFGQKRVDLNIMIAKLLASGISMRQIARVLECTYSTVYRKFLWIAQRAKCSHLSQSFNAHTLLFDEMESIEHTKLKPLSIAIAVTEKYKILGVRIGSLPAKGKLALTSRMKYGPRKDESSLITKELLAQVKCQLDSPLELIKSDAKPIYRTLIQEIFPEIPYEQHKSSENKEKKREQKYLSKEKRIHDPIFAVNHMCARLRDHIKRFTRRSWCTTKRKDHLELAVYLYIAINNQYDFI